MSGIIDVHVGKADDNWPVEEGCTRVHFHNFADLPQQKGTGINSSKFTCAGHEWFLQLYPRGDLNAMEGMVSVFLGTEFTSKIVVDFDIMLKKKTGDNFRALSDTKAEFSQSERAPYGWCDYASRDVFTDGSDTKIEFPRPNNVGRGWVNYASRDEILDTSKNILNNGTLTIEVRIRPENYCRRDATPKPSVADDLYKLYQDEDTADVAFTIKTDVFYAHKAILKARVPELAELAEPYDKDNSIPIKDVEPDIFEPMLEKVYGKDISENYWEEHARQILDASEKYGFTQLKLEAETWHLDESPELRKEKALLFLAKNVSVTSRIWGFITDVVDSQQ
eukprot:scaffold40426_cov21-Cyclotella_meneghiniana.AAC.2